MPRLRPPFLAPDEYGQGPVEPTDLIDSTGDDYAKAAQRAAQDRRYRDRMYGRAAEDSAGRWWLRCWFFYLSRVAD